MVYSTAKPPYDKAVLEFRCVGIITQYVFWQETTLTLSFLEITIFNQLSCFQTVVECSSRFFKKKKCCVYLGLCVYGNLGEADTWREIMTFITSLDQKSPTSWYILKTPFIDITWLQESYEKLLFNAVDQELEVL